MERDPRRVPLLALVVSSSLAFAQGTGITGRLVANVQSPVMIASARHDPTRLYIASQRGPIRILRLPEEQLLPTPFAQLPSTPSGNGVLGLAFHPNFAANGVFYVCYDTPPGIRIVSGHVSNATPDIADATYTVVASITSPLGSSFGQHSGGWIAFGRDDYLYIPIGNAFNSTVAQDMTRLPGKVLRLDVDGPDNIPGNADDDGQPGDDLNAYTIPPGNPFIGVADVRPEIWASGLRNPYRGSIDPATGDLWWGEVGDRREEINRLPNATAGRNMGYPSTEGETCTGTPAFCANPALLHAVFSYRTGGTEFFTGRSVMGGVAYRGCAIPELYGSFLFGDYFQDYLGSVRIEHSAVVGLTKRTRYLDPSTSITGTACFGVDALGEVYVGILSSNAVHKIVPAATRDGNSNGIPDRCEGLPVPLADFTGDCAVTIDDLVGFLVAFEAGSLDADYDDGTGRGLYDGAVSIEDLLLFLSMFEQG